MLLTPRDYLENKMGLPYRYNVINADEYRVVRVPGRPEQLNTAIIGLNKGMRVCPEGFTDAEKAYEMLEEAMSLPFPAPARIDYALQHGLDLETKELHDRSILLDILEFCYKNADHLFLVEPYRYADSLIVQICQMNGMPLFSISDEARQYVGNRAGLNALFENPSERWLYFGFYVLDLQIRIEALYCLYLLWCFEIYEDISAKTEFDRITDGQYMDNLYPLNDFYISYSKRLALTRVLEKRDGVVSIVYECDTLIAALMQQMMDIYASGREGLDGRSLFTCTRCGGPFIRQHGNAKLCATCNTNAGNVRACRARKKNVKGGRI